MKQFVFVFAFVLPTISQAFQFGVVCTGGAGLETVCAGRDATCFLYMKDEGGLSSVNSVTWQLNGVSGLQPVVDALSQPGTLIFPDSFPNVDQTIAFIVRTRVRDANKRAFVRINGSAGIASAGGAPATGSFAAPLNIRNCN